MLKNISLGHFSARSPYVNNELRPARCMLSSHVATADSCSQGITLVTGSSQIVPCTSRGQTSTLSERTDLVCAFEIR